MRSLLCSLLLVCFCLFAARAQADTFTTFNASGTFEDGSVLSGTLTVDTTIGKISSSNLIVSGIDNFTFVNIVNQSNTQVPGDYNVGDRNAAGTEDFNFDLPETTLVGYTGSKICSDSSPCLNGTRGGGNLYNLTTNSAGSSVIVAQLTAPTPEPSGLVLLVSGALGVAGALRRRLPIRV